MDFYKIPIGFGLALAANESAMARYTAMTQQQKQAVIDRARRARSREEMHQIVSSIANTAM